MPSSIYKTAALAVIGVLVASLSQSVTVAEAPMTRKRHLRSASAGTRALDDRDEPPFPQRNVELHELNDLPTNDSKEEQIAVGDEMVVKDDVDVETEKATKEEQIAVGDEMVVKEDVDVETTEATKEEQIAVGDEMVVKEDVDVETTEATKEEQVAVGEDAGTNELVDDASFLIRGHSNRSCEWLSGTRLVARKKWCHSKAFKKNKAGEKKPKVYEYCKATCCNAGVNHACAMAES